MAKQYSEAPTTRPVTAYVTQGVLLASDVFPGGPAAPRRFIVRDPQTYFINAYVQCPSGEVDLQKYVGMLVGVMGNTKFDKGLGLDVVNATGVKVLAENVEFPRPPQVIVRPMPTPKPPL